MTDQLLQLLEKATEITNLRFHALEVQEKAVGMALKLKKDSYLINPDALDAEDKKTYESVMDGLNLTIRSFV